ncbi:hypothetical protein EV401DRAFT_1895788 [Pisolithus croceorrhizus]|nr:hypothetical protein EV401DRAFT_1895788 [Pisolithus croceorrhizus]
MSMPSPGEIAWFSLASVDPSLVDHTLARFSAQWWQDRDIGRICSGEFADMLAHIVTMDGQFPEALEVSIYDFKPEFPIGASIKVIAGLGCGFQGIVISKLDNMFVLQGHDQQGYSSRHTSPQQHTLLETLLINSGDLVTVVSGPHKGITGMLYYYSGHEMLITVLTRQQKDTDNLGAKGKSKARALKVANGNNDINEDSNSLQVSVSIDDATVIPLPTLQFSMEKGYDVTVGDYVQVAHGPAMGVEGPVHHVDLVTGRLTVLSEEGPLHTTPIGFCLKVQDYSLQDAEHQVGRKVWIISGPNKGYRGMLQSVGRTSCKVAIHSGLVQFKNTAVVTESGMLLNGAPLDATRMAAFIDLHRSSYVQAAPLPHHTTPPPSLPSVNSSVELGSSTSVYDPWVVQPDDLTPQQPNEAEQQLVDDGCVPWLFDNNFCDYTKWHICLRVSLSYNHGTLHKQVVHTTAPDHFSTIEDGPAPPGHIAVMVTSSMVSTNIKHHFVPVCYLTPANPMSTSQYCLILWGTLAGQIFWVKKCQSKKEPKGVELNGSAKLPFGDTQSTSFLTILHGSKDDARDMLTSPPCHIQCYLHLWLHWDCHCATAHGVALTHTPSYDSPKHSPSTSNTASHSSDRDYAAHKRQHIDSIFQVLETHIARTVQAQHRMNCPTEGAWLQANLPDEEFTAAQKVFDIAGYDVMMLLLQLISLCYAEDAIIIAKTDIPLTTFAFGCRAALLALNGLALGAGSSIGCSLAYTPSNVLQGKPGFEAIYPLPVKLVISSPTQPSGNLIQFAELPQFHIIQLSHRRNEVQYYLFGGKTTPSSGISLIHELGYSRLTCPVFPCYLCQKNCTSVLSALDIAALGAQCKGGVCWTSYFWRLSENALLLGGWPSGKDFLTFSLGSDLLSRGKPVLVYCGGKSTQFRAQIFLVCLPTTGMKVEKAWYKETIWVAINDGACLHSQVGPYVIFVGKDSTKGLPQYVLRQNMDLSPTCSNGNDSQPAPLVCIGHDGAHIVPNRYCSDMQSRHTKAASPSSVWTQNHTSTGFVGYYIIHSFYLSPIPILQNVKYNSDFFKSFCWSRFRFPGVGRVVPKSLGSLENIQYFILWIVHHCMIVGMSHGQKNKASGSWDWPKRLLLVLCSTISSGTALISHHRKGLRKSQSPLLLNKWNVVLDEVEWLLADMSAGLECAGSHSLVTEWILPLHICDGTIQAGMTGIQHSKSGCLHTCTSPSEDVPLPNDNDEFSISAFKCHIDLLEEENHELCGVQASSTKT